MTFRLILVPLEDVRQVAVLAAAAKFARATEAYVEGLDAWSPKHAALLAADAAAVAAVPREGMQAAHRARQLRSRFEQTMTASGFVQAERMGQQRAYGWHGTGLLEDTSIAERARVFDVTVLARPNADGTSPRVSLVETVLFEAGRPILIVPTDVPSTFAQRIMIAWNGSTESARAVAFAMPLLKQAEAVIVLTVAGGMFPGPSGEDLAAYLAAHDVKVTAETVPGERSGAGAIFIDEASRRRCDLMVKGAYTQSRLRQMMFGGVTSQILWQTRIPVLMAH